MFSLYFSVFHILSVCICLCMPAYASRAQRTEAKLKAETVQCLFPIGRKCTHTNLYLTRVTASPFSIDRSQFQARGKSRATINLKQGLRLIGRRPLHALWSIAFLFVFCFGLAASILMSWLEFGEGGEWYPDESLSGETHSESSPVSTQVRGCKQHPPSSNGHPVKPSREQTTAIQLQA